MTHRGYINKISERIEEYINRKKLNKKVKNYHSRKII